MAQGKKTGDETHADKVVLNLPRNLIERLNNCQKLFSTFRRFFLGLRLIIKEVKKRAQLTGFIKFGKQVKKASLRNHFVLLIIIM